MSATDILLLVLVGLVAGGSGGLLGIGGSVIMIPGMVFLFGRDQQHLYQASAMIVNFFVMLPALWQHWRVKAPLRPVTRLMVPSMIVGIVFGVYASDRAVFQGSGQGYLQIMFAVFLLYVVAYNLYRLRTPGRLAPMDEAQAAKLSKAVIIGVVGLPTGILGGLLGIGGGLFAVPAQQIALKIPLPKAIANAAGTIVWSSVIGAAVKNYTLVVKHGFRWQESVTLALCLIPSAMIASWYTSAKVHRWPIGVIRMAFVVMLLYCGARMFVAGWQQVHAAG